ncbi:MAG: hypothetical protein U9N59_06860, partial [Campylobacterota bacterium]|nr:hypothetical protein [Campylobacterota bacterium]
KSVSRTTMDDLNSIKKEFLVQKSKNSALLEKNAKLKLDLNDLGEILSSNDRVVYKEKIVEVEKIIEKEVESKKSLKTISDLKLQIVQLKTTLLNAKKVETIVKVPEIIYKDKIIYKDRIVKVKETSKEFRDLQYKYFWDVADRNVYINYLQREKNFANNFFLKYLKEKKQNRETTKIIYKDFIENITYPTAPDFD